MNHMSQIYLIVYFAIILAIGYNSYKKVKNSNDFFIAGKKSGVLEVTGSLLATILGSSAIIGSVNFSYTNGWSGSWFMICASIGLLLLLPLVKYLKAFSGYNLPAMLGEFYGEEVKKISSLIIAVAWIGVVASQILGAAKIFTILTPYSHSAGVITCGLIFIFYTIMGGQLSVIKTDFFQLIFILIGIALTFFYISPEVITINPPALINEKFTYLSLAIMLLTYSSTFVVGPDIYSRLFCAKDAKTIRTSIIVSVLVLLPLAYIFSRIGIYGMQVHPTLNTAKDSVLFIIANENLPIFATFMFYFAILSAVISSADTTLFTASSLLSQVFIKRIDNQKGINMTRVFTVVIGIFSILVALKMVYILPTIFLAFAVYSGAIIIPTLVGMIGFRAKKEVVITALFAGGLVALIGKLAGTVAFIGNIVGKGNGDYIIIFSFVLNGLILFIGSKITKKD